MGSGWSTVYAYSTENNMEHIKFVNHYHSFDDYLRIYIYIVILKSSVELMQTEKYIERHRNKVNVQWAVIMPCHL